MKGNYCVIEQILEEGGEGTEKGRGRGGGEPNEPPSSSIAAKARLDMATPSPSSFRPADPFKKTDLARETDVSEDFQA